MKRILLIIFILFTLKPINAQEIERYKCLDVKTDIAGKDVVNYIVKKDNYAEFEIKDCLPQNLKITIKDRRIIYEQSRRLLENGRTEKNDLFAIECNNPFPEDGNLADYEGINFSLYRGKISPLITPEYALYPTLKQTAGKINLDTPHRTFIIFNGLGSSTHEFFCYLDDKTSKKPLHDKCKYTFDEILDIHSKNKDTVSLNNLGDKYLKDFEYEKAEKAYIMAMKFSENSDYEPLLSLYTNTKQYKKAIKLLSGILENNPYEPLLYIAMAKIYLYEKDYDRAEALIEKALKLRFESGLHEAYGILGEVYISKRDYKDAVASFEKASRLLKKECEDNRGLMLNFFRREDAPSVDCEAQTLPYQLKIVYSLIELEDFDNAEKTAKNMLSKTIDAPYLYGHLTFIYAGRGEFNRALEMADRTASLLKRRGIGAQIVKGEIYPVIVSVDINTPAERVGLKKGDKIINIGDKDLRLFREGKDVTQMVVEYIKNNETIRLTIHSGNSVELKDVELKPEEISSPYASQFLAFKALILRANGKHGEFEKQALKAYELNPKDKLSLITMALVNIDKGRYSEALEILEKSDNDVHDSLILLIRPLVYGKAKEIDKAKRFYREIPEELLKTKNALYRRFLDEIKGVL